MNNCQLIGKNNEFKLYYNKAGSIGFKIKIYNAAVHDFRRQCQL